MRHPAKKERLQKVIMEGQTLRRTIISIEEHWKDNHTDSRAEDRQKNEGTEEHTEGRKAGAPIPRDAHPQVFPSPEASISP